ncbi:TetR/AcrR family transcriptional regulator [Cutibacterium avidum]|uniref:TetR/AcrR family transcriptional regulator n=1 Tax=Cutibacterium avidum TaxID=33010 RepID=UPI001ED963A2|nr:TetR family transcriptional regulator [Cutibacterium avidum]
MSGTRVLRRQQATRERIVRCAMELFLEQGFEDTTVAQITEAADIGKGTFFTYFPTKQDVLSFLGEQVMAVMAQADQRDSSARDRLERVFGAAGEWYDTNEAAARQMVLSRLSALRQRHSLAREQLSQLVAEIVAAGHDRGQFPNIDVETATTLVLASYFAAIVQWAWEPGRTAHDRLISQLQLALRALETS